MEISLFSPRKDLEYIPVMHQGQKVVVIRDHLGLVQEGKAVLAQVYQFLVLLDSVRDMQELQCELTKQSGGDLVSQEELARIITKLDDAFLLDSDRFHQAREQIITDFACQNLRYPFHAGKSYPESPEDLTRFIDSVLSSSTAQPDVQGQVQAIVAPHIDISLGKKAYACAYSPLFNKEPCRVIVMGIGHSLSQGIFSLTDKDFVTPFGVLPCDTDSVNTLREKGQHVLSSNDFVHRAEHSIEFQTLFIHHVLRSRAVSLVPILCGSCQIGLPEYSREAFLNTTGDFLHELQALINRPDEETLIIAGVDFSHIGPKFGHDTSAKTLESEARNHDSQLIQALCDNDPETFWHVSAEVDDRYHVCGFSALACLLEVLPSSDGSLLCYDMWHEEATHSAVGFAAVCFSAR
jgi:hypothetical protein